MVVAREHGFEAWSQLTAFGKSWRETSGYIAFEVAVEASVSIKRRSVLPERVGGPTSHVPSGASAISKGGVGASPKPKTCYQQIVPTCWPRAASVKSSPPPTSRFVVRSGPSSGLGVAVPERVLRSSRIAGKRNRGASCPTQRRRPVAA